MRITESKLRRIIKDVINEIAASDDEALLRIGKGPIRTRHTIPGGYASQTYDLDYEELDYERAIQVFKAWCNKTENAEHIVYDTSKTIAKFFKDHPDLRPPKDNAGRTKNWEYMDALHDHASEAFYFQRKLKGN